MPGSRCTRAARRLPARTAPGRAQGGRGGPGHCVQASPGCGRRRSRRRWSLSAERFGRHRAGRCKQRVPTDVGVSRRAEGHAREVLRRSRRRSRSRRPGRCCMRPRGLGLDWGARGQRTSAPRSPPILQTHMPSPRSPRTSLTIMKPSISDVDVLEPPPEGAAAWRRSARIPASSIVPIINATATDNPVDGEVVEDLADWL